MEGRMSVGHLYTVTFIIKYSDKRGSAAEFAVFHIMSRILEAANGLCMPLPPGKSCRDGQVTVLFLVWEQVLI